MALYLVRHAVAVGRSNWKGDDDLARPLTAKGERQAKALVRLLGDTDLRRIWTESGRPVPSRRPLADTLRRADPRDHRRWPRATAGQGGRAADELGGEEGFVGAVHPR